MNTWNVKKINDNRQEKDSATQKGLSNINDKFSLIREYLAGKDVIAEEELRQDEHHAIAIKD